MHVVVCYFTLTIYVLYGARLCTRAEKNIISIFYTTTTRIKTTGVESKNITPYKRLTGLYLKNAVQIKTTGVRIALKHLSQVALLM